MKATSEIVVPNTHQHGLTFRHFQGEADYPLIQSILTESFHLDQMDETPSIENIRNWCKPRDRFDPYQDILFVLDAKNGSPAPVIGVSRVSWYTGAKDVRLYEQDSFLLKDGRGRGLWPAIIRENDRRLQEIAGSHSNVTTRFYQAWATATQVELIAALESEGYQAVRRFNNMLHRLDSIPERDLPAGLDVRAFQPEQYPAIWDARKEMERGLFETVAENWTDENYAKWLADPTHTPQLWQIAWDGDQVAGMILNRIDEARNQKRGHKRGYTEHIFVHPKWRKRGVASALISRSLKVLKAQGMEEAELGVDTINESGAYELYKRMGYQTFSTDLWYRKPMD